LTRSLGGAGCPAVLDTGLRPSSPGTRDPDGWDGRHRASRMSGRRVAALRVDRARRWSRQPRFKTASRFLRKAWWPSTSARSAVIASQAPTSLRPSAPCFRALPCRAPPRFSARQVLANRAPRLKQRKLPLPALTMFLPAGRPPRSGSVKVGAPRLASRAGVRLRRAALSGVTRADAQANRTRLRDRIPGLPAEVEAAGVVVDFRVAEAMWAAADRQAVRSVGVAVAAEAMPARTADL